MKKIYLIGILILIIFVVGCQYTDQAVEIGGNIKDASINTVEKIKLKVNPREIPPSHLGENFGDYFPKQNSMQGYLKAEGIDGCETVDMDNVKGRYFGNSMLPTMQGLPNNMGNVYCYAKPTDNFLPKTGDIIMFDDFHDTEPSFIIHRVINVYQENGITYWQTQGDNNEKPDTHKIERKHITGIIKWIGFK